MRELALVGSLSVFEEEGFKFARVAGTSAGAIVGSLVAAGMPASAMHKTMRGLDYGRLRDETALDRIQWVGHGLSLWREQGVYAGEYLQDLVAAKLADVGIRTFEDLREETRVAISQPTVASSSWL